MANERAEELRDAIQEVLFFSKRWPRPRDEEEALSKAVQCIREMRDAELSISGKDTPAWLQSVKTATIQIVRTAPGDEWYPLAKILKQAQDELWGALPTQTGNSIRSHCDRSEIELDPPIVVWQPPFSFELAKIDAEFGLLGLFCHEPLRTAVRLRYGSDDAAWEALRAAMEEAARKLGSGASELSVAQAVDFVKPLEGLVADLEAIVKWEDWRKELKRSGLYLSLEPERQYAETPPFDPRELVDAVWRVVSTLSPDDYPPDPGRVSDPREAIKHLREVRRWCAKSCNTTGSEPESRQPPVELADIATPSTPIKPKRSTVKGEAKEKLITALTKHHQYADGGCLNLEPIGLNKLAKQAGVSGDSANRFFNRQFNHGKKLGHKKYEAICQDAGALADALKSLRGEFTPAEISQMTIEAYEAGRRTANDE